MRHLAALAALPILFALAGCNCGQQVAQAPTCVDGDGDGVDSCSNDCNDADKSVFPGAPEACDGKDNNCDGQVDEGCTADSCRPGDPARACGKDGKCSQACGADGMYGACLPATGATDYQTDVKNCGGCGVECPTAVHATAACLKGACGRGPCEPGFFDFDGAKTFGCEAKCTGATCTLGDGTTVTLTTPPLPETGHTWHSFASGSSVGERIQTNTKFTNMGVLGDQPGTAGEPANSASYKHVGGFTAAVK